MYAQRRLSNWAEWKKKWKKKKKANRDRQKRAANGEKVAKRIYEEKVEIASGKIKATTRTILLDEKSAFQNPASLFQIPTYSEILDSKIFKSYKINVSQWSNTYTKLHLFILLLTSQMIF